MKNSTPASWRCLVQGCPQYGKWQQALPGHAEGGHYDRVHASEQQSTSTRRSA